MDLQQALREIHQVEHQRDSFRLQLKVPLLSNKRNSEMIFLLFLLPFPDPAFRNPVSPPSLSSTSLSGKSREKRFARGDVSDDRARGWNLCGSRLRDDSRQPGWLRCGRCHKYTQTLPRLRTRAHLHAHPLKRVAGKYTCTDTRTHTNVTHTYTRAYIHVRTQVGTIDGSEPNVAYSGPGSFRGK